MLCVFVFCIFHSTLFLSIFHNIYINCNIVCGMGCKLYKVFIISFDVFFHQNFFFCILYCLLCMTVSPLSHTIYKVIQNKMTQKVNWIWRNKYIFIIIMSVCTAQNVCLVKGNETKIKKMKRKKNDQIIRRRITFKPNKSFRTNISF